MSRTRTLVALAAAVLTWNTAAPAQGVRINEMDTGPNDYCELINLGTAPVHLGGWQVIMNRDPSDSTSVTFPQGTVIDPNEVVVIAENPTTPSLPAGVQSFSSLNIWWSGTTPGSCALNDAGGAGVDLVTWGGASFLPAQNPPPPWTGFLPMGAVFQRTGNVDNDTAADWTVGSFGTPGAANPNQPPVPGGVPSADLLAVPATVPVGVPVQFLDLTSGIASAWQWDLDGDGAVDSTSRHPTWTYASTGSFDVTLTASNAFGSDTVTVTGAVTVVASVAVVPPHVEDFDGGSLGPEWTLASSNANGRIQLTTDGNPSPGSGGNALVMDVVSSGTYATNTATLSVDLTGGEGILKYWFRETLDEDDPEDGVFISDGVQTVQVVSHNGSISTWTEFTVDLVAQAMANGLMLTQSFSVVLSQRDNFPVPTDGAFFDDVRIVVPDTGQANQSLGSLVVEGSLNQNGSQPEIGINGPFFASDDVLTMTVEGGAGQPWLLLLGPLNRNNLVLQGIGSLDVGLMGAQGSIADVDVLLDGFNGTSFLDQFAVLDPFGRSVLSFGLQPLPPGVLGTFQAVVGDSGGGLHLTAACEFTVTP